MTMREKRITKEVLRQLALKDGFTAVSPDSYKSVFNPTDSELTRGLWMTTLAIAKFSNVSTIMEKHSRLAYECYCVFAKTLNACPENDDAVPIIKWSKKTLKGGGKQTIPRTTKVLFRQEALREGIIEKVSPNAIKELFDTDDPILSAAKWNVAVKLANTQELRKTKTLVMSYAEVSNKLYACLQDLLEDYEGESD